MHTRAQNRSQNVTQPILNAVVCSPFAAPPPPGSTVRHYFDPAVNPPPPPSVQQAAWEIWKRSEIKDE
eukprot:5149554-Prymnesium_polylepis.1